jgi:hypothetical protein
MANNNLKFVFNDKGFKKILNCKDLDKFCFEIAEHVAEKASEMTAWDFEAHHWHSNMNGGRVAAICRRKGGKDTLVNEWYSSSTKDDNKGDFYRTKQYRALMEAIRSCYQS